MVRPVPGMKVLGRHETGSLEAAVVEDVFSTTVAVRWTTGPDAWKKANVQTSNVLQYEDDLVGSLSAQMNASREKTDLRRLACSLPHRHAGTRISSADIPVPDDESKRVLVPRMLRMMRTVPVAEDEDHIVHTEDRIHTHIEDDTPRRVQKTTPGTEGAQQTTVTVGLSPEVNLEDTGASPAPTHAQLGDAGNQEDADVEDDDMILGIDKGKAFEAVHSPTSRAAMARILRGFDESPHDDADAE